jgi:transcriptional regulator with XRE-family HTH domain
VGEAVARARKAASLTQVQLAQAASVQQAEISRIERGHANPTVTTLARIAAATGSRLELVEANRIFS